MKIFDVIDQLETLQCLITEQALKLIMYYFYQ